MLSKFKLLITHQLSLSIKPKMATYSELHNATEELCLEDDLFLDRVKPNSKWRWSPFFLRISMSILFICLMVIGIFSRRFDRISRSGTQYQSGIGKLP